jgi:hypothetical protein
MKMEAVWGGVLSFLFILATLSGYGTGTPQPDKSKEKSEQSEKKDEEKKNEEKKSEEKKSEEKEKSGKKPGHKGSKTPKQKAEFCIKDCPEAWRIRQ